MTMRELEEFLINEGEWNEEQKMKGRMASFKDAREHDTEDWDSRLNYWRRVIRQVTEKGLLPDNLLSFHEGALESVFQRKGKKPMCLQIILKEMEDSKEIVNVQKLVSINSSWSSWAFDFVIKNSLTRILQSLGIKGSTSKSFVFLDILENVANIIYKEIQTQSLYLTDNIFSKEELLQKYGTLPFPGKKLSESDMDIVLLFLQSKQKIAIGESKDDITIVKFMFQSEKYVQKLNDVDFGVYSLKRTLSLVRSQLTSLEKDFDSSLENAKLCLIKKDKKKALFHLKRKNVIEPFIRKKEDALHNLEKIFINIQSAQTDKQVFEACVAGRNVLGELLDKGETVDSIEDVMNEINELIDDHQEISEALSSGINNVDSEELEQELEEMIENEKRMEKQQEKQQEEQQEEKQKEKQKEIEKEQEVEENQEIGSKEKQKVKALAV